MAIMSLTSEIERAFGNRDFNFGGLTPAIRLAILDSLQEKATALRIATTKRAMLLSASPRDLAAATCSSTSPGDTRVKSVIDRSAINTLRSRSYEVIVFLLRPRSTIR